MKNETKNRVAQKNRSRQRSVVTEKNVERDLLYEKPADSDVHKTAWMNVVFRGLGCK